MKGGDELPTNNTTSWLRYTTTAAPIYYDTSTQDDFESKIRWIESDIKTIKSMLSRIMIMVEKQEVKIEDFGIEDIM